MLLFSSINNINNNKNSGWTKTDIITQEVPLFHEK